MFSLFHSTHHKAPFSHCSIAIPEESIFQLNFRFLKLKLELLRALKGFDYERHNHWKVDEVRDEVAFERRRQAVPIPTQLLAVVEPRDEDTTKSKFCFFNFNYFRMLLFGRYKRQTAVRCTVGEWYRRM